MDIQKVSEFCRNRLFSNREGEYGSKFRDHYLKQYLKYVESIGHVSDTRQKINSYFLTLNTFLLAALGLSFTQESSFVSGGGEAAIPFVGAMICFIWWAIMYSYKQRGVVKEKILHCMEEKLPLAPYSVEWDVMGAKNSGVKYHFFKISLLIPWVFVLLYLFIIIFSL
jgi:hypothetical protein